MYWKGRNVEWNKHEVTLAQVMHSICCYKFKVWIICSWSMSVGKSFVMEDWIFCIQVRWISQTAAAQTGVYQRCRRASVFCTKLRKIQQILGSLAAPLKISHFMLCVNFEFVFWANPALLIPSWGLSCTSGWTHIYRFGELGLSGKTSERSVS